MSETVKVIVRCRPMNSRENGLKCNSVININTAIGYSLHDNTFLKWICNYVVPIINEIHIFN